MECGLGDSGRGRPVYSIVSSSATRIVSVFELFPADTVFGTERSTETVTVNSMIAFFILFFPFYKKIVWLYHVLQNIQSRTLETLLCFPACFASYG